MQRYSVYFNSFFVTLLNLSIQTLVWISLIWYFEALDIAAQFTLGASGVLVGGLSLLYFYFQSQTLNKPPGPFYWISVEFIAVACCLNSSYVIVRCFSGIIAS